MRWKNNRKSAIDNAAPAMSDKVAKKIARIFIRIQKHFANKMNKAFGTMNNRRLKIMLILFCVVAGGYSFYLIVNAVTTHPKADSALQIDQANIPKHFNKTGEETVDPESYVDQHTYSQIQIFKAYIDSLKVAKSPVYDSIVSARPYLMDSIKALERLYYTQTH